MIAKVAVHARCVLGVDEAAFETSCGLLDKKPLELPPTVKNKPAKSAIDKNKIKNK